MGKAAKRGAAAAKKVKPDSNTVTAAASEDDELDGGWQGLLLRQIARFGRIFATMAVLHFMRHLWMRYYA